MYNKNDCTSFFSTIKSKHQEFKLVRERYEQLSKDARNYQLQPTTPAALAEREEAKRLDKEMTRIVIEMEQLHEETKGYTNGVP